MAENIVLNAQQKNVLPLTMRTSSGGTAVIPSDVIRTVSELPENPEIGTVVALNTESPVSWSNVKVWRRDEILAINENGESVIEHEKIIPVDKAVVGTLPETLDFSDIDREKKFLSSICAISEDSYLSVSATNTISEDGLFVLWVYDGSERIFYLEKGVTITLGEEAVTIEESAWYNHDEENDVITKRTDLNTALTEMSSVTIRDETCALNEETYTQYVNNGTDLSHNLVLEKVLRNFVTVYHDKGMYVAEEKGGVTVWSSLTEGNANTYAEKAYTMANDALEYANEAKDKANEALSEAKMSKDTANNASAVADQTLIKAAYAADVATGASELTKALRDEVSETEKRCEEVGTMASDAQSAADEAKNAATENAEAIRKIEDGTTKIKYTGSLVEAETLEEAVDAAFSGISDAEKAAEKAAQSASEAKFNADFAVGTVSQVVAGILSISYDNASSGLKADNLQNAIDELSDKLDTLVPKSWADVQQIVRGGQAPQVFSIGDQLICSKNGAAHVWDVIGFDVDTPINPNYTHSMTLQLNTAFEYRAFDDDSNDYSVSAVREYLNGDYLTEFDEDFLSVLGGIRKSDLLYNTDEESTEDDIYPESEIFFLLSADEVSVSHYEYYSSAETDPTIRIKTAGSTALCHWWLRSNSQAGEAVTAADKVGTDGNISAGTITRSSYYLAPACVIY